MLRLAWATDIHINHLPRERSEEIFREFLESARASGPDGLLLGGDISEAPNFPYVLSVIEKHLDKPVWFVLGNHDCYWSSIAAARDSALKITENSKFLRWLPEVGVVPLTKSTALIGVDGWGDGRYGKALLTPVSDQISDHVRISELMGFTGDKLFTKLAALGDESAGKLSGFLKEALPNFQRIIVLTHVPPFEEACWYNGKPPDDDWLPHFACKATGNVLREAAKRNPACEFMVLAGHTHGSYEGKILPNLQVICGGAKYGAPVVQCSIDVE